MDSSIVAALIGAAAMLGAALIGLFSIKRKKSGDRKSKTTEVSVVGDNNNTAGGDINIGSNRDDFSQSNYPMTPTRMAASKDDEPKRTD